MILILLLSVPGYSHEGHHKKIDYYTKIIVADSTNQEAYFLRGIEFQSHGDFEESRQDFFKVLFLKPDHKHVKLNLARLYHEHLKLDSALLYINDYILTERESNKAYECRAQIYNAQKKYELAIQDYLTAISFTQAPTVEVFFALSKNYEAITDIPNARKTLEEAMNILGPIIPIRQALIDLEVKNENWVNAHSLVDAVIAEVNRKETWHISKAELFEAEGKVKEAEEQYVLALQELNKLNPNRRNTDYSRELERSIESNLKQIRN
jgi:tetratricopeptide (TPR) repeat protein